ncbi:MAG: hypothetical protein IIA66_12380 [Planctomycetes bacterium]|nr:hypothetical protein [Planctomycetota bacterium]
MNATAPLAELADHGIAVHADGTRIRLNAPAGALTPDLLAAVKSCKAELLELLTETAGVTTYADREWARFLSVAVATSNGLRDPAEPVLQRGVPGADWDGFVADCGGLGKAVRA